MTLNTRQPTGAAGWPMLLVEGKEGTRKTSECLRLTADPRVGSCFVIEAGERRVDEYATLGSFEVVEHDGSLHSIVRAIYDVMALPPLEGRPTVLIIDSGTHVWDLVKRHAEHLARSSREAQRKLEDDENAEITVGHQAWNRAKDPWWWAWMNDMRAWPGVLVMTARADEVSKFVDGKPVMGQTDYRVDVERGTPFIFDATVRMHGAEPATVTTAKSLKLMSKGVAAPFELPVELPLAHLVFDLLEAGTSVELNVSQAKTSLLAQARSLGHDADSARAAAGAAWKSKAGTRTVFDHKAMSALISALQPPEPTTAASSDDSVAVEAAESGSDALREPEQQQLAESSPEPVEGLTEDGDQAAFASAPAEIVDHVVDVVRRMGTTEVDHQLVTLELPLTGNVQARRARLAARLVHVETIGASS